MLVAAVKALEKEFGGHTESIGISPLHAAQTSQETRWRRHSVVR